MSVKPEPQLPILGMVDEESLEPFVGFVAEGRSIEVEQACRELRRNSEGYYYAALLESQEATIARLIQLLELQSSHKK